MAHDSTFASPQLAFAPPKGMRAATASRWSRISVAGLLLAATGCAPRIDADILKSERAPSEARWTVGRITAVPGGIAGPIPLPYSRRAAYAQTRFFDISDDGSVISFVLMRGRISNVYVADAQRASAVRQRTFRDVVSDVSLSADGRQFVFTEVRGQRRGVYLAGVSGGTAIRQISPAHVTEDEPSFAPDGRRIVYVRSEANPRGGTRPISSIVSLDLTTGVTTHHGEGRSPTFFPDGRRILCTRLNAETGRSEIWIIDGSTGAEIQVIALRDQDCLSPSASPDGSKIAFAAQSIRPSQPANFDVFVVGTDGGRLTQVTSHLAHDISPRWASDGRALYVLSQRGSASGDWQVWKLTPTNGLSEPASKR